MSQAPVTVTYSLEEVLGKIDNKLDNIQKDINGKLDNIHDDIKDLRKDVNELKIGQARLEEKVGGLGKQVQNQEFINRGILVALIVALVGGAAKLFGWVGNP